MFVFRDTSLERKLKLITMLTSGAALLVACVLIITYDFIAYRRLMTRDLETLAELLGNNSAAEIAVEYKKEARETLERALKAKPHIVAACIYDKNGQEFAPYVRDSRAFSPPKPQADGYKFLDKRLILFRRVFLEGEAIGTIYLESELLELHSRLRTYAASVFLVMIAALGAAFVLSSRLQRVISAPLLHLAETAKTVSHQKNYSVRATKHGNDELGQLIDGFNEMLGQIQARDAALQTAHDGLEKRVEERTRELQQEISERKQAERVVQQQFTRISLLNQITQAISERQDVQSILSIVLHQIEEHLPVCCGAFYLFNPEKKILRPAAFRARTGDQISPLSKEISLAEIEGSDLEKCVQGQTIYLPDTALAELPMAKVFKERSLESVVALPMIVEGKLFGLLLAARREAHAFSSGECEFLKMLSEQVALAGYHAQLYTQLQSAYDELRETQQAVMQHERLRALGQMASGIAHDINNALSPVVGFAELLLITEKQISPAGARYLQHIRTSSEDIAHIVSRLREFYRKREDNREMQRLHLNQLAEQVIDLTRPRWRDMSQERGVSIAIQTHFSDDLPPVMGIASELREGLTNLILNAVDALPKEGTITVRAAINGWTMRNGQRKPSEVALEVQDNGVGMDEETRRRCLEPFFSTKGVRGTGLGLAMVYGIMERHDGRIEIDSERGKGTTIRLVFPVQEPQPTAPTDQTQSEESLPRLRILFVDDEPLLRQLVQGILENDGHSVCVADGGQKGVAEFQNARVEGQPFDVVITDLGMPQLDGRRLAQILKQDSPEIPIIMLTGWGALMRDDDELPGADRLRAKQAAENQRTSRCPPPGAEPFRFFGREIVFGLRASPFYSGTGFVLVRAILQYLYVLDCDQSFQHHLVEVWQ
jgi:signal transduction histidine kinase